MNFRIIWITAAALILVSAASCSRIQQLLGRRHIPPDAFASDYETVLLPYFRTRYTDKGLEDIAEKVFLKNYTGNTALRDSASLWLSENAHPVRTVQVFSGAARSFLQDTALIQLNFQYLETALQLTNSKAFSDSLENRAKSSGLSDGQAAELILRERSRLFRLRAEYLIMAGQAEDALAVYESILKKYSDPAVHLEYGRVLLTLNRYSEALSEAASSLELQPFGSEARELLRTVTRILNYSPPAAEMILNNSTDRGKQALASGLIRVDNAVLLPDFFFHDEDGREISHLRNDGKSSVMLLWSMNDARAADILSAFRNTPPPFPGTAFYALNTDAQTTAVKVWMKKQGLSGSLLAGPRSPAVLGAGSTPCILITDREGMLRFRYYDLDDPSFPLAIACILHLLHPEV